MKRILLITGSPGLGKTTLLSAVAEMLAYVHPSGFLTTEKGYHPAKSLGICS